MKYWLLTTEYPPFYGGGIGTYCQQTAIMLTEKGHEVTVIINDASVSDFVERSIDGVRVIRFSTSRTKSSMFLGHVTNISYEFAIVLRDLIELEGKPDYIEAQEYLGIAYYFIQFRACRYEWASGINLIVTIHSPSFLYLEYNSVPLYQYPNFWIGEMEKASLRGADLVISPSSHIVNEIEKRYNLDRNVPVVANPFSPSPANVAQSAGSEIVFYGKLSQQKGTFHLLKYFKQLWQSGFEQPLYLIGGQDIVHHPEGISMGDLIKRQYAEFIRSGLLVMEDRIRPSEVATRMLRAAVVIVPSIHDNLPYVVLEMMALGKIVLVSKQGGQSEIVEDGRSGFVFDHNIPGSFEERLRTILSLEESEKAIISLAAKQRIATHYNHDSIYSKKLEVIQSFKGAASGATRNYPFVANNYLVFDDGASLSPAVRTISVVIPYYNMGEFVEATVNSVLLSEDVDPEIIIVNDGSTDAGSLAVLDKYRAQGNIRVIDKRNGGLASARNAGADLASGEYLAFLDADDLVEPTYYRKALDVLSGCNNVFFTGCWTQYFGDSHTTWPCFNPEPPLILYHNLVNSSALVYKKVAFLKAGRNDAEMPFTGWEDYMSVISMVQAGYPGVVIPEVLFRYRVRKDSMVRSITKAKKLVLYEYITRQHSDVYGKFAFGVLNLQAANGPGFMLDNPTLDRNLLERLPFNGKLSLYILELIKKNRTIKKIAYRVYKLLKK